MERDRVAGVERVEHLDRRRRRAGRGEIIVELQVGLFAVGDWAGLLVR